MQASVPAKFCSALCRICAPQLFDSPSTEHIASHPDAEDAEIFEGANEVDVVGAGVVDVVCADVVVGGVVVGGGVVVANVVVIDVVVGAGVVVGFGVVVGAPVVVVGGILQSAACRAHPEHESHCWSTRRWAAAQASLLPANSCSEANWIRFLHGDTTSSKSHCASQPPDVVFFDAAAFAAFAHQACLLSDHPVARLAYPAEQLYGAVVVDVSVDVVLLASAAQ